MQPGRWVRIHALQKHACWRNVLRTYAPSGALGAAVGTANGASRAGGDCPGGAWPAGRTRPPTDATPPAALSPGGRARRNYSRAVEPVETTPGRVESRRAVEDLRCAIADLYYSNVLSVLPRCPGSRYVTRPSRRPRQQGELMNANQRRDSRARKWALGAAGTLVASGLAAA